MEIQHESLSSRFAAAMEELKLSQTTLGKMLAVSQRTISDYKRGEVEPSPELVQQLENLAEEKRNALEEFRTSLKEPSRYLQKKPEQPSSNIPTHAPEAIRQLLTIISRTTEEDSEILDIINAKAADAIETLLAEQSVKIAKLFLKTDEANGK